MSSVMSNEMLRPLSLLVSPDRPVNAVANGHSTDPVPITNDHVAETAVQPLAASMPIPPFAASANTAYPFGPTNFAAIIQPSESALVQEQTYSEWIEQNIVQSKWTTPFVTFYAHWLLAIVLAILVVHGPDRRGEFAITASTVVPDELAYEPVEILDTRIVEVEPETALPHSEAATVPVDMSVTKPTLPESITTSADLAGAEQSESGVPVASPAAMLPRHAVTRGSFSVWTVPDSPDAGEAYKIVIQAKVPNGTKRYPVTDLQGVVVGSDGYRKLIPGSRRGFLPIDQGYVQFEVHIVAADAEIKDAVWIQSRMLKEQQKLLIEF